MWLCNSSIGRKVIMSVTGMALILFLTFHGCMNVVALISGEGYNKICEFLGANWYAVAATVVLMALIFIHIVYAFILTLQNRKARGNNRYAVTDKPDKVEWSSQNMLLLGIIVLLGLILHLYNFWYNMMFAELAGMVSDGSRQHSAAATPVESSTPACTSSGSQPSGFTSPTVCGQPSRLWAGAARCGSNVGSSSATSM